MASPLHIEKFSGTVRRPGFKTSRAFYFRVVAANGRVIAASEGYTTARARNKTAKLLAESKIEVTP